MNPCGEHQVLVAHQLRHRRRDLRSDTGPDRGQLVTTGLVVEDPLTELPDRQSPKRFEGLPVEPLENQPAHLIGIGLPGMRKQSGTLIRSDARRDGKSFGRWTDL